MSPDRPPTFGTSSGRIDVSVKLILGGLALIALGRAIRPKETP